VKWKLSVRGQSIPNKGNMEKRGNAKAKKGGGRIYTRKKRGDMGGTGGSGDLGKRAAWRAAKQPEELQ